jgi:hypothetical protein
VWDVGPDCIPGPYLRVSDGQHRDIYEYKIVDTKGGHILRLGDGTLYISTCKYVSNLG